jgi:FHS family glucose/mannose:H+ symporter-like MFS transporter
MESLECPAIGGGAVVRNRAALAFICCAALFAYAVYFGALGVFLLSVAASFHVGAGVAGRLFPAQFGGFVLGVLCSGYVSDRIGRKAVLLLGIAFYAIGLALFSKAPVFVLALPACGFIGAGTGAMETVACAFVSDLYPDRRAFVLNGIQVAFGLGAAPSPALAHRLLEIGTDWRALFLGIAAAAIALGLALAAQPAPPGAQGAEAVDFARLRAIVREPAFRALCLAQALYVGAECTFFSWVPTFMHRSCIGGAAWAGLAVTMFWTTVTVGRIATGGVVNRFPALSLIRLLAIGGAVAGAFTLLSGTATLVMVGVGLTGLFFSGIFGLVLAEAGERYPSAAGTVFSGVVAAGGIGGALVPWIAGIIGDSALGWRAGLAFVPALMIALTVLAARIRRM